MKHTYLFRKTSLSAKLIFLWIIVCLALVVPLKNAKAEDQAETPLVSSDMPAGESQSIIDQKPQSEISKEPTANLKNEQENILPDATSAINADTKAENKPEPEKPKEDNQEPESQRLNEDQASSGTGTGQSKSNQPSVDQASGALQYSYPIVIPPGRSGLQPDLKLSYSSQSSDENGAFGLGWNIGLPSISRINKTGSQQLYTQNNFTSSLSGELVDLGGGNFGSKVDNGEFLSYNFANNSWTVKDKKGVVYKFGSIASSRQDDPLDGTRVYQWLLTEVRDANDNFFRFEYFKDAGQIYPSRIVYTGSGNSDGIFSVDFFREGRTDVAEHYRPGFKVATNFRINRIEISVLGSWVRKYDLAYGVGNDGSSSRLNSIIESGRDETSGAVISLPPVSFNYQASTGQFTEETSSWQLPDIYFNRYYNGADKGGRLVDVNGDSLQDLVVAHNDGATNDKRIFLNTGSGWSETSGWQIPSDIWLTQSNERDTGWRIADINGDMLADFIISYDMGGGVSDGRVYLNNGVNGWTLQTNSWFIPGIFFAQSNNTDPGGRMADINSDGLPDLFMAHYIPTNPSGPITDWRVYLNTGNGWTQSTAWIFPEDFHISNYYNSKDQGTRMLDINSDGLLDAVTNYEESPSVFKRRVYINIGSGWALDNKWALPGDAVFTNWNGRDFGWRTIDINNDGRVDLVKSQLESGVVVKKIYLNNGTSGFVDATSSFQFPDAHFSTYQYGWDAGLRDVDVTGDGLTDLVWSQHENAGGHIQKVFTHNGLKPNLLNQILYSTGAATSIQYQNSSLYRDSGSQSLNPQLPTNLFTVKQLSHNSGFGNVSTIDYSYEHGKYFYGSPQNRKFAGFGKITKTNSAGTAEASYFHQGDSSNSGQGEYVDHESKIGKMYRTEIRNSGGQLYSANINRFDSRDLGNGRNFVYQMQTVNQVWDGLSIHTDTAQSFEYEDYGNITFHTQWGEVSSSSDGSFSDIGSDKRVSAMFYSHNGGSYLHSHLNNKFLYDFYGTKVSEQKIYYDDSVSLGSVMKGNPTRQENWVSGSNYIATNVGYSPQGLPTVTIDPRGYQTTIAYDAYNLYPTSITNPLNQVVVRQYDYSSGKEKQVTDANSFIHTISYDGLDRPREEKQPDQVTPAQLVLAKSYSYGDSPLQNFVAATEYLSDTISKISYEYLDGFGRVVQARVQSGDVQYTTADTEYNSTGNIGRSSLPYFSGGSSRTQATSDNSLYTNYQYDALGRAISQTNVLGALTTSFEGLKTVVTDQLGKSKRYYNDAFGQLASVEELNNSEIYTTAYQYNLLGKLTKVTDANGNIRQFNYDALSNRLLAQDLHGVSDVSYGSWVYVYDASSNLVQTIDPKGQVINYSYDQLNRLIAEDFTGITGIEQSYIYDTCTNGKGQLCSAVNTSVSVENLYNSLGMVEREIKTIGGTTFQTDYSYFRGGQVESITQPDLSIVGYIYGQGTVLERVNKKETGSSQWADVVSGLTYSPTGQLVSMNYADGSQTTSTYDAQKQYRLTHKVTMSGSNRLQDVAYTYDAVGNITHLVDSSQTKSAKTVDYTYDDLNRLLNVQASSVAAGQQPYAYSYTYNAIGNMLTRTEIIGVAVPVIYSYEYLGNQGASLANPHAPTSISNGTVTNVLSYDANGNLTSDSAQTYTWDYQNRLASTIANGVGGGVPVTANFYATSGDGSIYKTATSWDPAHDAVSGTSAGYTASTMTAGSGKSASTTYRLDRAFFGFDTASLPDNVNVTDAVLKVHVDSKLNNDNDGDDWVTVLQGSQPSTSALAVADYDLAGTINTPIEGINSSERKDISSVATGQYLNLNLNAVGKSWVSKTGSTKLALREGHDVIDSPVVASSGQYNQLTLRSANYTGTTSDPVLSVTYTTTPPPVTTNYGYDSEGQRVSSTNGSLITKYPSKFYNFDGATSQKHILLGDLSVATVKGSGVTANIFYNHADHLAGSSVLTNSSGSTEEVLDYFPYGTIRVDDKAGSFEEQRKYIGQEWDGATGLSYLNARYYNPASIKFLSQDPLFWELPKEYLIDPQQQNSYAYARNNPIIGSDPTGLLNIIIPGTGYGEGWNSGQDGGQFLSNVTQTFGGNSVVFASATLWTGDNTDQARQAAANNLKSFVDKYFERHSNDHTLNIVAHSHGGNVAALFSQIADRKIDNLVTLGTPIRSEYKFNEASIGSHYNVFSLVDFVQVLGGNNISKAVKITDGFIDNPFINNVGKIFGQIGEIGTAGRIVHQKGVKNIDATALTMKAVPFVGPHSKLWTNSRVWKGLESIIKK